MIEDIEVWMVHLRTGEKPAEIRGTLSLREAGLLFTERKTGADLVLAFDAIDRADFPVLRAYTLLVSVLVVSANVLTDVLYGVLDPRVRRLHRRVVLLLDRGESLGGWSRGRGRRRVVLRRSRRFGDRLARSGRFGRHLRIGRGRAAGGQDAGQDQERARHGAPPGGSLLLPHVATTAEAPAGVTRRRA